MMHSGVNTMFSHPLTGVASTKAKDKRFVDPMHLRVLAHRLGPSPSSWTDLYSDLLESSALFPTPPLLNSRRRPADLLSRCATLVASTCRAGWPW